VNGVLHALERDDLNLGRYGIRLATGADETSRLAIEGDSTTAEIRSVGGSLVDEGAGRLEVVAASEDLLVSTPLRNSAGGTLVVSSSTANVTLAAEVTSEVDTGRVEVRAPLGTIDFSSASLRITGGTEGVLLFAGQSILVGRVESAGVLEVESTGSRVDGWEFPFNGANLISTSSVLDASVVAHTGADLTGSALSGTGQMQLRIGEGPTETRTPSTFSGRTLILLVGGEEQP